MMKSESDSPEEYLRSHPLRQLATAERFRKDSTEITRADEEGILATFTIINGFAARLTKEGYVRLRADPRIASIEPSRIFRLASSGTQFNAPWHLDKIDQRDGTDGVYSWVYDGSAGQVSQVKIYVIDSGIELSHPEFGGRASFGYSYYGSSGDCNGHGTAVAGVAGGQTYGVAKGAGLVSVRVTSDCSGNTNSAALVAAMDWVRANNTSPLRVANVSIALGGTGGAVGTALANLASSGVTPVVAVGDNGSLACNYFPGNSSFGIKVGASNQDGSLSATSNSGSCLDVIAPGQNIVSAGLSGGTSTNNGTSFSAAIVSGMAARILHENPYIGPWYNVKNQIVSNASPNRVSAVWQPATANLLSFIEPITPAKNVLYSGYNSAIGYQQYIYDSMIAGSVSKSLPLRTFRITTSGALAANTLSYQAFVNGVWQPRQTNFAYVVPLSSNTIIKKLRIRFESPVPASICYQVHVGNVGWMAAGCDDAEVGDGINDIQALRIYVYGYSSFGF